MASPATRRALANIHPNTPISNNNISSKGKYNRGEKMAGKERMAAGAGVGFEKEGSVESLVGSEKRGFGNLGGEEGMSAAKKVKRYTGEESEERGTLKYGGGCGGRRYAQNGGNDELLSPSPSVSPVSSFGSSHAALNDSQQTVLTEPDQLPTAPNSFTTPRASSPLTKEQAREKSKKLRLRLQLAAYKVQTNQIEVPMDRLELRSSSVSSSPIPPRPSMQVPSATVPRPSTARERVPTIQLQGPSAEKGKRNIGPAIGSSPPPRYGGNMRSPQKQDVQREYASPARSRLGGTPSLGGDGDAAARDLLLLRESASKKS